MGFIKYHINISQVTFYIRVGKEIRNKNYQADIKYIKLQHWQVRIENTLKR